MSRCAHCMRRIWPWQEPVRGICETEGLRIEDAPLHRRCFDAWDAWTREIMREAFAPLDTPEVGP